MDAEARRALLEHAIRLYGEPAQMDMAVEEMAELTKAICKVKRASCAAEAAAALENAVEEMADVQIMLDQLRIIFHRSTEEIEEAKLERLAGRLHTRYVENGMIREAERGRSHCIQQPAGAAALRSSGSRHRPGRPCRAIRRRSTIRRRPAGRTRSSPPGARS